MRSTIRTLIAYAVGTLVVSISSVVIYQWVMVVPVVVSPTPVTPSVVQQVPRGMLEPMEVDATKPAGRLLPMPQTGRE